MPELNLNISYSKNEGLVMSPSNLTELYLSGIPMTYPNGGKISDATLRQKLIEAQKQIENMLSIKINRQICKENKDFIRTEFLNWGYVKSTYPIAEPIQLEGKINEVRQVLYPKQWLSTKRGNEDVPCRNLFLIPNTQGGIESQNASVVFSGISPNMAFFGSDFIPNYWGLQYWSGWEPDKIPADITGAIGKFVAIQTLAIVGDLISGAGIGNQSVSLDGISQQYSTTKGGGKGAFSGRVQQYTEELVNQIPLLKAEYLGINFRVM